jgi:hypothetical protein
MSQGPPKAIEAIVALLIPPARREEVLGDLHERYRGTAAYLADALRTVPHVVASQIRRTTDPRIVVFEALALYVSFLTGPPQAHGKSLIFNPAAIVPCLIPVVVAVVALRFVDAYARPEKRTGTGAAMESLLAVATAYGAEELLRIAHPELALPRGALLQGGVIAAFLVWMLRATMLPSGEAAKPAAAGRGGRALGPQDFQRGIERLQGAARRRNIAGTLASLVVIAGFGAVFFANYGEMMRIGALLMAAAGAYMGSQTLLISILARRFDLKEIEPANYSRIYRVALEQQRDYHRGGWLWSRVLVLVPGYLLFCAGMAMRDRETVAVAIGCVALFLILLVPAVQVNMGKARSYQREIDRVDAAEKKHAGEAR